MKKASRSVYPFVWLFALVCALSIGMAATHAQDAAASQTPSPSPSASLSQTPRLSPTPSPSPTPTPVNWSTDPMLKRFVFRGIGPASMGGRIDDFAVVESNPYIMYIGFATGGVWNRRTTVRPFSRSSIPTQPHPSET